MKKIIVAVGTGRPGTRIAEHAGRTKHFLLYEIHADDDQNLRLHDKKQIELADDEILHEVLHRFPIDFTGHPLEKASIVLTRGIGAGAMQKLFLAGKRAYRIAEKDPDEAIRKLMEGRLQALPPESHHHHDHSHHHGHHGHHDHPSGESSAGDHNLPEGEE